MGYPSDVTDAEWNVIYPLLPPAKPGGRPRTVVLREVVNALFYFNRSGCAWRMLPKDFPPFTTVQGYFYDWRDNSLFETINFTLLLQAREAAGHKDLHQCACARTRATTSYNGAPVISVIFQ